jgi:hypothetical protein
MERATLCARPVGHYHSLVAKGLSILQQGMTRHYGVTRYLLRTEALKQHIYGLPVIRPCGQDPRRRVVINTRRRGRIYRLILTKASRAQELVPVFSNQSQRSHVTGNFAMTIHLA